MTDNLDADKRELGVLARKDPRNMGIIKERAKELGISTVELLENAAKFIDNPHPQQQQAPQPQNNEQIDKLTKMLESQQQQIQMLMLTMQQKPHSSGESMGFKEILSIFKELKAFENNTITQYKQMAQEIAAGVQSNSNDYEEEDPVEQAAIQGLMSLMSQKLGLEQPNTPVSTSKNPNTTYPSDGTTTNKETKTMDLNAVPKNIKQQIQQGKIEFESNKDAIKDYLRMQGHELSDEEIKKGFEAIKRGE